MMQKSLSSFSRAVVVATLLAPSMAAFAAAQTDSTPARPQGAPAATVDSAAFERARQMVLGGNAVAGRTLADSLVQAMPAGTPAYGDALYWRATIAATAADAERDYRRIIIEYPLAPHAGDALLALAQLEVSRGDRVSATSHLDRFLLEFPERSDRPRAGLWLGRLLLEQNDVPRACAVLRQADAGVPADQVELKNQIEYYTPRCIGVDTTTARPAPNAAAASATAAPSTPPTKPTTDTAHGTASRAASAPARDEKEPAAKPAAAAPKAAMPVAAVRSTKREAAPATAKWTVQIAAYQTSAEADALASKMKARAYDAYVARSTRIYRVRIGHFATREDALALLSSLRQRGTSGFVTTADPSTR